MLRTQCISCLSPHNLSSDYTCCDPSCLTCKKLEFFNFFKFLNFYKLGTGTLRNECSTCLSPLVRSSENSCCHSECSTCNLYDKFKKYIEFD
jgi:hypothetical protein